MDLTFIQLSGFVNDWRRFRLTDEDLRSLEQMLLARPEAGAVVSGTGGVRKVRFAPPSRRTGKSGAYRVVYLVRTGRAVLLLSIFAKAEKDNLTAEQKARFKTIADSFKP
jgi:hypothetical protein